MVLTTEQIMSSGQGAIPDRRW